jgi:hypothetical protein
MDNCPVCDALALTTSTELASANSRTVYECGSSDYDGTQFQKGSKCFAATNKTADSGSHYRVYYKGTQLDPYRLASILDIADPAVFHAFKKLAFAGKRGAKDFIQDLVEARDAINRKLEMLDEDND